VAVRHKFGEGDRELLIGEIETTLGTTTVKGNACADEIFPGNSYRFFGHWSEYTNQRSGRTERQFAFSTYCETEPLERDGVIEYLKRIGTGAGIGKARAEAIWNAYGGNALQVIRDEPETLRQFGLFPDDVKLVTERLEQQKRAEATTIELLQLFAGRKLPHSLPTACVKKWGVRAPKMVRRDPFRLMEFRGVGFERSDNLWHALGRSPSQLRRQTFALWHTIDTQANGSVWLDASVLSSLPVKVGGDCDPGRACRMGLRLARREGYKGPHGKLAACSTLGLDGPLAEGSRGSTLWLADAGEAACERSIAKKVAAALSERPEWPQIDGLDSLSSHQLEQLRHATRGKIGILAGSPGTGKTYTAARLIQRCADEYGARSIAIGAPTGKAAQRITEAMRGAGLDWAKAQTWHSLLGVDPVLGLGFWKYHEWNPWRFRVLIGDESSMLDQSLFRAILDARGTASLLLIGDTNQLPPVGSGAPLRDLIAANLPCGELREIKRNSGGIVEACAAIRDRQEWQPGGNLIVVPDHKDPMRAVLEILEKEDAASDEIDVFEDCQVIVATNERGNANRKAFNEYLQNELNPSEDVKPGQKFREFDKIICLTNGSYSGVSRVYIEHAINSIDREDEVKDIAYDPNSMGGLARNANQVEFALQIGAYLANGEVGRVVFADQKVAIAKFAGPRFVQFPQAHPSFDLAYAVTCHKSQGSEWPVVVVVLDPSGSASRICDRSWLYTAISRAKQRCYLVGDKATADKFCRVQSVAKRKTFLAELILREQAARSLETL